MAVPKRNMGKSDTRSRRAANMNMTAKFKKAYGLIDCQQNFAISY